YIDQWSFLAQLTKMTEEEVTRFIQRNAEEDQLNLGLMEPDGEDMEHPWESGNKNRLNDVLEEPLPAVI
ncbi:MAG: hypothetical protein K0R67_1343, partial [Paenibacillus sp.]|nr:hypothetical protein [Paenibacillus sp.]